MTRIRGVVDMRRDTLTPESMEPEVDYYSIPALDANGRPETTASDEIDSHKLLLRGGEVLTSRLNPRKSRVHIVPEKLQRQSVASTEFVALRPVGIDAAYLAYLLQSERTRQDLDGLTRSATRSHQRVEPIEILNIEVPIGRSEEQRRIADFLDDRVARIDQIIAARQQQVAGLDEQFATERRLAIRGLAQPSADAPAPSWIGHVGQGWMTRRIGQLAAFYAGVGFPPDEQGATTGDLPLLKVSDLANSDSLRQIGTAANWITLEQASTLGARPAPAGTILLPKVGAALLTNNRAIATRSVTFDNNVMGIRFRHGDDRFWLHVLHCIDMGAVTNPGPVPSINRENVASLPVPFPAPPVQAGIAAELDAALVDSRARRTQLEQQITLLNEYKQSLITAAVTGEFDVTTAAPIPE